MNFFKSLILFPILILASCSEPIDESKLQNRNGIYYEVNGEVPFTGEAESFYENGQKKFEGKYSKGLPEGIHRRWHYNGVLTHQVEWKTGKKAGVENYYNERGYLTDQNFYIKGEQTGNILKLTAPDSDQWYSCFENFDTIEYGESYSDDGKYIFEFPKGNNFTGKIEIYFPNGELCFRQIFVEGLSEGVVQTNRPNGMKYSEDLVSQGGMEGKIQWNENGSILGESYLNNGNGVLQTWHENGQIEQQTDYKDGVRNGKSVQFYEDGKKSIEVNFLNGRRQGSLFYWGSDGNLIWKREYKEGKLNGPSTEWYEDGQKKREETYKNDLPEGVYKQWDKTGNLIFQGEIKEGNGLWVEFSDLGKKSAEGIYKDGKKYGLWSDWYSYSGKLNVMRQCLYYEGQLVKIIKEGDYLGCEGNLTPDPEAERKLIEENPDLKRLLVEEKFSSENLFPDETLKGVVLGDLVFGNSDAPITMIEYASMTCPQCANFHRDTFPLIKEKYIETGKVKFVFRNFVRDPADLAVSMITRCFGTKKAFNYIDLFFQKQKQWATSDPKQEIAKIARKAGISRLDIDNCFANTDLQTSLINYLREGQKKGVSVTPTFFINGKIFVGEGSFEEFSEMFDR